MALVTTFATTPLTLLFYPPWYQRKLAAWRRGEIDWDGNRLKRGNDDDGLAGASEKMSDEIRRLLICLRLDSLPGLFTFVDLLGGEPSKTLNSPKHPAKKDSKGAEETTQTIFPQRPVEVHGLRLLELTERLSSVMKESEADDLTARDPVVNAFHTFGQLHNVAVSGDVQLVPDGAYADVLGERAADRRSDMILLPWSDSGTLSEVLSLGFDEPDRTSAFGHAPYNHFVCKLFKHAPCSTAVFVNNGFGAIRRDEAPRSTLRHAKTTMSLHSLAEQQATAPIVDRSHHIFLPFFGGPDDHVAVKFVLRLAQSANVTATITFIESELASDRTFFEQIQNAMSAEIANRVVFDHADRAGNGPEIAVESARAQIGLRPKNAGDLVVLGRNLRTGTALKSPTTETFGSGLADTLGSMAEVMVNSDIRASLLVVQAGRTLD